MHLYCVTRNAQSAPKKSWRSYCKYCMQHQNSCVLCKSKTCNINYSLPANTLQTLKHVSWISRDKLLDSREVCFKSLSSQARLWGYETPIVAYTIMQMLAKPSSNLPRRTEGDHRGSRAQLGWIAFMMTCLRWILGYMRLEIWHKIGLSADWCLYTALRTRSGARYYDTDKLSLLKP